MKIQPKMPGPGASCLFWRLFFHRVCLFRHSTEIFSPALAERNIQPRIRARTQDRRGAPQGGTAARCECDTLGTRRPLRTRTDRPTRRRASRRGTQMICAQRIENSRIFVYSTKEVLRKAPRPNVKERRVVLLALGKEGAKAHLYLQMAGERRRSLALLWKYGHANPWRHWRGGRGHMLVLYLSST